MNNIFAEICKVNDEQRMVYGYASTEALDVQGEIVTKEAISGALDEYMKFANIREMHQPSAVGVAKSAEVDDKGLYISCKVVDESAWQKVKEGVYKGFSIGGKALSKVEGVIKSMRLSEISLVDRPANPEALITVWKADMDNQQQDNQQPQQETVTALDQLAEMLNKGEVTPERLIELAKGETEQPEAAAETTEPVASDKNATEKVEEQPAEDGAAKGESADGVAKGFEGEEVYDAQTALDALVRIQYLLQKERAEDEEMPEQIAALTAAVESIKNFIVSEIKEDNSPAAEGAEKSESADDVAKAGRMISAANLEKLQAVHDACVGMGCKCDMGAKKSDEGEDIAKADMIAKVAKLETELQKAIDERDLLKGELAKLKEQPAPGKALLKAVTVSKSDDQGNPEAEASGAPVIKDAHGNVNEAASLIKMIHQTGGAIAR